MASTQTEYRPDIDGLRAIAVLAVVGFHAFPTLCRGGFVGVDVFFVISGFLITSLIHASLQQGTFRLRTFYGRRIRRIFPALVLVLAVVSLCGWMLLLKDEYRTLGSQTAASVMFIVNIMFWLQTGYFDVAAESKPLLHLWSLAVEEQFYLFWPVLLWVGWRHNVRLASTALLLAAISFLLNVYQIRTDASAAFFLAHTRFWEFLLGALALTTRDKLTSTRPTLTALASLTGGLLLVLAVLVTDKDMPYPGGRALLPTLATYLLIVAGNSACVNRTMLTRPWLVWLGLISYPLYLWHWPLLSFSRLLSAEPPSAMLRLGLVLLAVVLAWITYQYVERPLRFGGQSRRKITGLLLCMLGVGGLGAYTFFAGCVAPPFANAVMRTYYGAFDFPRVKFRNGNCTVADQLPLTGFCMASSAHPEVALIGDSHGHAIYDFVSHYEQRQGRGLLFLGSPGCVPLLGVERHAKGCAAILDSVLQIVNNDAHITRVLLTGRFAPAESGHAYGTASGKDFYTIALRDNPHEHNRQLIFQRGFERLIEALQAHGKHITVILDAPELDFDPKSCLRKRDFNNCLMTREAVLQKQQAYTDIIRAVQSRHSFNIVDLKSVLCEVSTCPVLHDARFLYRDSHHLSPAANDLLLQRLSLD